MERFLHWTVEGVASEGEGTTPGLQGERPEFRLWKNASLRFGTKINCCMQNKQVVLGLFIQGFTRLQIHES